MRKKFLWFGFVSGLVVLVAFRFYMPPERIPQRPSVMHASFFSQPEFYDEAYASAQLSQPVPEARGVLLNHHLLAAPYIAEALSAIATDAPVTVVLISPNHFSAGQGTVITSEAEWGTPYGLMQPDLEGVHALTTSGAAYVDEAPFEHEHGVTGIVAFIKRSLPRAKIIPLIVNDRLAVPAAQELAKRIHILLPQNVLVVGSFDFSHYLPSRAAQFHDELSLSTVQNFDYSALSRLDIDSRPGLALFLQMMEERKASQFTLFEHTNSAELTRAWDTLETTSYITGYFSTLVALARTSADTQTLLFLGRLEESSEVLASLETRSKRFAIEYLQRLLTGQQRTVAGTTVVPASRSVFSRLGFTDFVQQEQVFAVGSEKVAYMVTDMPARARELLDQGSRVVCVTQGAMGIEEYNGGLIIRGLGDWLTTDVLAQSSHMTLAVGVAVQAGEMRVYLLPIRYTDGKAQLLVGQADDTLLTTMATKSAVSEVLKKQIKTGILTIKVQ